MLNEWDKDHWYRDTENECTLYNWWMQMPNKPKMLSFEQAKEYGIVKGKQPWKDLEMNILDSYGWSWLERGPEKIPEATSHLEWNEWTASHDNNMYFHANKIQWLVNCIRTEGLYSVPQAYLAKREWFCHPGQFRVYAIEYTGCNEEFVVWDKNDYLREPELTFDEWYSLYRHHDDKALFAVKLDDNRIEMHVGEEREDLYKTIRGSHQAFGGRKPILDGTCDDEIKHLFNIGKYMGIGMGIKGHVGLTDLRDMLDFYPTKEIIKKENFTLYNNYHK